MLKMLMVCILKQAYCIVGNFDEGFNLAIWQIRYRSPNKNTYCTCAYGGKHIN